jgi:hypothetical protein
MLLLLCGRCRDGHLLIHRGASACTYRAGGKATKVRILSIAGGLLLVLAPLSLIAVKYAQKPSLLNFVFVVVVVGGLLVLWTHSLLSLDFLPRTSIWCLVDWIMILTDDLNDSDGYYLDSSDFGDDA